MRLKLIKPGLFVTATDTGVGKTVVACAIAAAMKATGVKVGVCKPVATGCRLDREGLVSPDAEALAHFADCRAALAAINPVRYHAPLAPAVAAEMTNRPVDYEAIADSLRRLDRDHDVLLVEGIGGIMVPLGDDRTVLDLMKSIGYPVLVVTRATLGTLNHTAMTCKLIRDAGLTLAGLVVNRYVADSPDPSVESNRARLARQNDTQVLATVPELAAASVAPHKASIPPAILEAVAVVDWRRMTGTQTCESQRARRHKDTEKTD